ncbi:hypothetical protein Glove_194g63 [Diversispora epigaea]|uniref:Uncharacterized protein n=1 Tax=Diversispora epigaea TaxID=1348612 RepID=A0A397IP18_9GLOM|nr:hypothetical protein Glove_194g63 [Diversispora epigaea]
MKESLKESQENMRNIVEQRVSSAENKFLCLIVVGIIAGGTKSWCNQAYEMNILPNCTRNGVMKSRSVWTIEGRNVVRPQNLERDWSALSYLSHMRINVMYM